MVGPKRPFSGVLILVGWRRKVILANPSMHAQRVLDVGGSLVHRYLQSL